MPDYTPDQEKIVRTILKLERTDYYKVLSVEKGANDVEIKKSYRKLAIKLHPDKNKHPQASEAFKVIAKAFEVLGDGSKRKLYDMTGHDPDSRSSAPSAGFGGRSPFGFSNGARGFPAGQQGFDPDDIFNIFFNGMGGGNGMRGGHPGFSFQFGGNGFPNNGFYYNNGAAGMNARRRAAGGGNRRRGQNETGGDNPATWTQYLYQFLPVIFILASMLLNMFGDSSNSDGGRKFSGKVPRYTFESTGQYNIERSTPNYGINYYLKQNTVNDFSNRKSPEKEFKGLDTFVETQYIRNLQMDCKIERNKRDLLLEEAYGIFFNDYDKIDKARNMELPHCQKLRDLKLI